MEKIKPIRDKNERKNLYNAFENLAEETMKYSPEKFFTPLEQDPLILELEKDLKREKEIEKPPKFTKKEIEEGANKIISDRIKNTKAERFRLNKLEEREKKLNDNSKELKQETFSKLKKNLENNPEKKLIEMDKMNTAIEEYNKLKSKGAKRGKKGNERMESIEQYLKKAGVKFDKKNFAQGDEPTDSDSGGKMPKKRGRPPKSGVMKKTKKTKKTKETAQERKKRMEYIRSFKKK